MYHWLSATFFTLVLVLSCIQLWLMIREEWDRIVGALTRRGSAEIPTSRITTWARNRARSWAAAPTNAMPPLPRLRAAR